MTRRQTWSAQVFYTPLTGNEGIEPKVIAGVRDYVWVTVSRQQDGMAIDAAARKLAKAYGVTGKDFEPANWFSV